MGWGSKPTNDVNYHPNNLRCCFDDDLVMCENILKFAVTTFRLTARRYVCVRVGVESGDGRGTR